MKRRFKMILLSVGASLLLILGFQNLTYQQLNYWSCYGCDGDPVYEAQLALQKEMEKYSGDIVVEGSPYSNPTMSYESLATNNYTQFLNSYLYEVNTGEIVVEGNPDDACQEARDALKNEAKQSANDEIVVVGEVHGEIDSQYGDLIDSAFGAGDCLALEAQNEQNVNDNHNGWAQATQHARSRGMSVHYIDSAASTYYSAVTSSGLSAVDQQNTLTTLMEGVSGVNRRDAEMAANLNSLRGSCNRILSLNGRNHVFRAYDDRAGRINLMENLAQLGSAKAIDASKLSACEQ